MYYSFTQLCCFFLIYSFFGWVLGVAVGAFQNKQFANTGFMTLPLCPAYGVGALMISVVLAEQWQRFLFPFVAGAVIGAFVCICTGIFLEHILHKKWWDYSKGRFQFQGYLSIWHLLFFGTATLFILKIGNPGIIMLVKWIPNMVLRVALAVIFSLIGVDLILETISFFQWRFQLTHMRYLGEQMENTTLRLGNFITRYVQKRIMRAYPQLNRSWIFKKERQEGFARGCCFYKLFWLFIVAAFLGDIIETVFCRLTMGVWMSRSSLVYGPFSVVWGLGCALFTAFLYKYKDRPFWVIFLAGTLLGGVYEYVCSVFTELVFGTVFWDYSKLPLNLGGRINLLYCVFWGVAAIVWFKVVYPLLSGWIERLPMKFGTILTWILVVFICADMGVSALALTRYSTRQQGVQAESSVEAFFDRHFDDERMNTVYPKAKIVKQ
jgi:uncharacterized membrane protein